MVEACWNLRPDWIMAQVFRPKNPTEIPTAAAAFLCRRQYRDACLCPDKVENSDKLPLEGEPEPRANGLTYILSFCSGYCLIFASDSCFTGRIIPFNVYVRSGLMNTSSAPTRDGNVPTKKRILVLDDESIIADTLAAILALHGYEMQRNVRRR